jgi:hypothetical protein
MALQNNPSLYTGGAERFNSRPSVALYANLMARQQAKEDAYDEYIRSLNKNVNPAGMRNQERQVFDEKLAEWQRFGMENRDAIRKRAGGVDMEFQRKYQDLLNTIQESKTEEERKKPAIELLLDPNKRDRIDEDGFMRDITSHDAPLYIKDEKTGQWMRNPDRKSLDFTGFSFNPKMMETEDWRKYDEAMDKAFPADKTNTNIAPHPKDKFTNLVTTAKVYSPDKLKGIGDTAINDYESDRRLNYSFRKTHPFKEWKEEHEAQFSELNAAFQKAYPGRNISNESELFAATQIQRKLAPTVEEKTEANWEARDSRNFEQQKELQRMRDAAAKGRILLRNSLDEEEESVDEEMINAFKDAYTKASNMAEGKVGVALTTLKPSTQNVLIDKAKKLMGDDKLSQADVYIKKSGNNKIDLMGYEVDENGKQTKARKLGTIDFVDMNIPANTPLGVKAKREVIEAAKKQSNTPVQKSNKPKKVVQNGVEYTWNEQTQSYE